MANFFKNYGLKSYAEKHKNEEVEEIETSKLKGHEAPDPRTLGGRKQSARNRAIYGSVTEEEK